MRDTAFGLLPDFFGCAMVVGLPVGRVRVLVGVEIFFRLTRVELACSADCAVGAVGGIGINNVRAVGEEDALALDGDVLRHAERNRESFGGADHGVGNACVAAGRVEQSIVGGKLSAAAPFG